MSEHYVIRLLHAGDMPAHATGNLDNLVQLIDATMRGQARLGNYLKSANIEAFDGRGEADFTSEPGKAKRFATYAEAFEFWRAQSATRPLREDGQPNRPLTAFNVEIQKQRT